MNYFIRYLYHIFFKRHDLDCTVNQSIAAMSGESVLVKCTFCNISMRIRIIGDIPFVEEINGKPYNDEQGTKLRWKDPDI